MQLCHAVPFLAERRLVIVEGLLDSAGGGDAPGARGQRRAPATRRRRGADAGPWRGLREALADLPPTTDLVFQDGPLRRNNPLLRDLAPVAQVREFPVLRGVHLQRWVLSARRGARRNADAGRGHAPRRVGGRRPLGPQQRGGEAQPLLPGPCGPGAGRARAGGPDQGGQHLCRRGRGPALQDRDRPAARPPPPRRRRARLLRPGHARPPAPARARRPGAAARQGPPRRGRQAARHRVRVPPAKDHGHGEAAPPRPACARPTASCWTPTLPSRRGCWRSAWPWSFSSPASASARPRPGPSPARRLSPGRGCSTRAGAPPRSPSEAGAGWCGTPPSPWGTAG